MNAKATLVKNAELLLKIRDWVKTNPHQFYQKDWVNTQGGIKVYCIGALALHLTPETYTWVPLTGFSAPNRKGKLEGVSCEDEALKLLGITKDFAKKLFSASPQTDWPKPFSEDWQKAYLTTKSLNELYLKHAEVAVSYLSSLLPQKEVVVTVEQPT